MTIEPITDERLAEIRARLTPGQTLPSRVTILSILSRLDKAEATLRGIAEHPGPNADDAAWCRVEDAADYFKSLPPPPSES